MSTPSPLSNTKRPKRKKPIIAAILGIIFGPLSTLYFGWKVLVTTLIIVAGSTLAITWAMPIPFPKWFPGAVSLFFAFWNFILAHGYNAALNDETDTISLAALNLIGMEGWYIRFLAVSMGLYSGVMLVKDERYLAALSVVFLLIPLTIWLFESITKFLLAMLMTAFEGRR